MTLIRRENNREVARQEAPEYRFDPFRMVDTLLRWDPFRGEVAFRPSAPEFTPRFDSVD